MKRFSVSRRCISIKTYQHSEIAPFPQSFSQKPHRRSTWPTAFTTFFLATPLWTSRTTADHMDSDCRLSIVRHVSFDKAVKVLFTSIKAILSCHLTWLHVNRLRNRTSQQSNWHLRWTKFFKMSQPINSIFQVFQSVHPGNQFLRAYNWN